MFVDAVSGVARSELDPEHVSILVSVMINKTHESVSFDETDTRSEEMNNSIAAWVEQLSDLVNKAKTSEEFHEWLDVQSRFHDYSYRNTLLITLQCPHATQVAGYNTWREEFDRYVKEGEQAIWIWAPIIAKQCPECGNSPSYHENSDCNYDEKSPDEWTRGLVGFRPVSVFDVSQTTGKHFPNSTQQPAVMARSSFQQCSMLPTRWRSRLELFLPTSGSTVRRGVSANGGRYTRCSRWLRLSTETIRRISPGR